MPVLVIAGVDLALLFVALAALLALFAFWVFGRIIETVLGHIPIPFVDVGHIFTHWLESVMRSIAGGLDALSHQAAHWFYSTAVGLWHILYQLVATIADAKQWAVNAWNHADSIGAGVAGQIAGAVAGAEAIAASEVNQAVAAAEGLYNQSIGYANAVRAQAFGYADAVLGQAEAYANDVRTEVHLEADALYNQAIGYANVVGADVSSEAVTLFGQAEALAQGLTDSVQSEAVRLFGEAEAYTDQIVAGLGVGVIAGEIAGIIPRVLALEAEATTCVEPLCDTITPNAKQLGNLGNLLKGLDGIFDAVLISGLLAAAVADPKDAAQSVVDVTGWVPTLGVELADAVGATL